MARRVPSQHFSARRRPSAQLTPVYGETPPIREVGKCYSSSHIPGGEAMTLPTQTPPRRSRHGRSQRSSFTRIGSLRNAHFQMQIFLRGGGIIFSARRKTSGPKNGNFRRAGFIRGSVFLTSRCWIRCRQQEEQGYWCQGRRNGQLSSIVFQGIVSCYYDVAGLKQVAWGKRICSHFAKNSILASVLRSPVISGQAYTYI